ncbi:hypothetical protein ALC60_07916 [Trachymyrmex zeteki]|uniref:Uncharacterized protein n=1 Tax=Mycetomoellerius zeteki TaxID=64791 RepID=A0A151WZS9_9HYME|nr:hypothetical protein ALC60_07916 [Trachymyrmex zeteki]
MLLIEDADRIEIRIADLLADLKVVVAVIDKRLRVLAEVERPQPLDHDVACHGHLDALTLYARGPRLRPRSFVSLQNRLSFCSSRFSSSHLRRFRFATIPPYYPLYSSAATTVPRGRPPVDDVTSIEGRIVESRSIQQVNRGPLLLARHSPLTIDCGINEGRLAGDPGTRGASTGEGGNLRRSRSPLDMYRSSTHHEIHG